MDIEMSREEVQDFAGKLDAFGRQLSAKEQGLLHKILRRAAAAEGEDVEGYDFNSWVNPETVHQQYSNPYAGAGAGPGSVQAPPAHVTSCAYNFGELVPIALDCNLTYGTVTYSYPG